MIQRIQSLFLLLAAACYVWAVFLPIATLKPVNASVEDEWSRVEETEADEVSAAPFDYTAFGVKDAAKQMVCSTVYIAVFQCLLAVASIVLIFMYKNRVRQAKGCLLVVFLGFVQLALMLFICPDMIFTKVEVLKGTECIFSMWTLMSILPILLIYVSNKFILRDEKLVRAADRLR